MHIRGRAPVLIEAKTSGNVYLPVAASVRRALEGYRGPAAVMSFNPNVLHWFARHAPRIVRGLVMTEDPRRPFSRYNLRRRIERQLSLMRAKPHFLAFDVRRLPSSFVASARSRMPVLTWTVRTEEQRAIAAQHADQIIFELAPGDAGEPA
jgi:glycerophosphoryl diester phosphodiesterase